jgi:hypothetical protein
MKRLSCSTLSCLSLLLTLSTLSPWSSARAADANGDARLKDALRKTMLQLRTAEADRAALQASQTELEAKNKAQAIQVETLTKQCAKDKVAADKTIGDLKAKLEAQTIEIAKLNETVNQWRASQKQAADLAASKEAQRAKLAEEGVVLKRQIADQQTKNYEMYKLGMEVVKRYERFGLGEALLAREPFTGNTKVKFQNLIQDYSDKLADQKIKQ